MAFLITAIETEKKCIMANNSITHLYLKFKFKFQEMLYFILSTKIEVGAKGVIWENWVSISSH